jgi:hypothetical protein
LLTTFPKLSRFLQSFTTDHVSCDHIVLSRHSGWAPDQQAVRNMRRRISSELPSEASPVSSVTCRTSTEVDEAVSAALELWAAIPRSMSGLWDN